MRINPDPSLSLIALLEGARQQESSALEQLGSGRRVSVASDNPAAMATMAGNRAQESAGDEFLQSIGSIRQSLSAADSALSSVVTGLERAVSLAVEGANGTKTAANRRALAEEITGIRDQVLSLANLSFRGRHLFAGTLSTTQPFQQDSSVASGVRYDGNSETTQVEIGEGRLVSSGVSGDQIFADPASGVFASLDVLCKALSSNNSAAIESAGDAIGQALEHVSGARVSYGNTLAQLDSDESYLRSQKIQWKTRENDLVGADPEQTISNLREAQFARDATLAAAARTSLMSLLDYLR